VAEADADTEPEAEAEAEVTEEDAEAAKEGRTCILVWDSQLSNERQ
jgi:hypothetical protein